MEFDVSVRRANVVRIGRDASPVICVDDFCADPEALVTLAEQAAFIDVGSNYPGVRAPAPAAYVRAVLHALAPLVERHFGAPPEDDLDLCAFSMVTKSPGLLRASQRIPHFDGPESRRIALLHYLCAPRQGGTSFYRHRVTGLETVSAERAQEYRDIVARQLREKLPMGGYASAATPGFERIHRVDAAFNRIVVYPGNLLHSGDIGPDTVLSEDPRRGRLTINGFGFLRS